MLPRLLPVLGLALAFLVGCGSSNSDLSTRKIRAVTTTGMITDIVEKVGGERVEVTGLMGPGVDPHLYKASLSDRNRMSSADVIFYNGLHLEGKMGDVFENMGKRLKTVAVTDRLDRQRDVRPAPEGYEGTHDPHVWFDVTLWMKAVEHVRDTLAELDPGSAELYRTNAKNYLAELAKLHEYVKTEAKKVPPQHRVLVTAHDAFYYFGHAYGFKIASVQGISTLAEARPQDIQKLADEIVRERYPAIFVESSVPKQTIEKVQAAARAQGYDVKIGGELFSDAMGDKGTPEGTYVGMVRHNIDTIVKGLAR